MKDTSLTFNDEKKYKESRTILRLTYLNWFQTDIIKSIILQILYMLHNPLFLSHFPNSLK